MGLFNQSQSQILDNIQNEEKILGLLRAVPSENFIIDTSRAIAGMARVASTSFVANFNGSKYFIQRLSSASGSGIYVTISGAVNLKIKASNQGILAHFFEFLEKKKEILGRLDARDKVIARLMSEEIALDKYEEGLALQLDKVVADELHGGDFAKDEDLLRLLTQRLVMDEAKRKKILRELIALQKAR
jgi:hypothetical protein